MLKSVILVCVYVCVLANKRWNTLYQFLLQLSNSHILTARGPAHVDPLALSPVLPAWEPESHLTLLWKEMLPELVSTNLLFVLTQRRCNKNNTQKWAEGD